MHTLKCADCGYEGLTTSEIQDYGATIRNSAGIVTIVFYLCGFCRLDPDEPLPVRVRVGESLSSTTYLNESDDSQ